MIIGTRSSKLAITQTQMVVAALRSVQPHVEIEIARISTAGDRIQDRPLSQVGGKALFVAEIESALRERRIHLAVHSSKDIPSDLPDDMCLAAYLPRADARDVMISHIAPTLAALPPNARVGTSSPRRASQLRAMRPDFDLRDIRGNVDTRLAKLDGGEFDAIILAAAGLVRLGLAHRATQFVPLDAMVPCAGQGAVAIEVLRSDVETLSLVQQFNHHETFTAVTAERAFALKVGGNCDTPLAAHATVNGDTISMTGMIGNASGQAVHATLSGATNDAASIGTTLAEQLLAHGGAELLASHVTHHA